MFVLFVHNNFPAQFTHLAPALMARGHKVAAIAAHTAKSLPGVPLSTYKLGRGTTKGIFDLAIRYEVDTLRGMAVARVADMLDKRGQKPDLIVGHCGWGETLFLKDVWPDTPQIAYAEFFTRARGLDVDFDPEFPYSDLEKMARVTSKNGGQALALTMAERGISPTAFQRDTYPKELRAKIDVIHEGVNTQAARPRPDARLTIGANVFKPGDEVVTYINRHMEPIRGVHIFLRALPKLLDARPNAHVVVIGAPGRGYGLPPPDATTWKDVYLKELGPRLDLHRVHFLGHVEKRIFLDALAVSAAHVFMTYPFVLSWSVIEAMSAGCLVLASDTAPVRDVVVQGRNGVLFDFFDHEALGAHLIEALAEPRRFAQMRAQARSDALARFDLSVCVPKAVELVEQFS